MIDYNSALKIHARYAAYNKMKMHPFQQETLEAVSRDDIQIIIVEAPVGSGKSRIMRNIALDPNRKNPFILTYPTKILMETQLQSLKNEGINLTVWPYDLPKPGYIQAFNYSTDALIKYMKKNALTVSPDRSSLWQKVLFTHQGMGGPFIMITTPDVLWLLFIAEVYRPANKLQNYLQNAIVVFDEFHLYYGLDTFPDLIQKLLSTVAKKIILLSATPILSETLKHLKNIYSTKVITFEESENKDGRIFNYPLRIFIHTFQHTDINEEENVMRHILHGLPTPTAIIMDSVFRLAHIRKKFAENPISGLIIKEWSGRLKEEVNGLKVGDIILGTSSIEVGIDMVFKSAIIEAWEWPATIQRLGRIGRHAEGVVHLFTRSRDLEIAIGEKTEWGRTEFEQQVLKAGLVDPRIESIHGSGFRGRSFPMLMYDEDLKEAILYSEQILCYYEVSDRDEYWQEKSINEKRKFLEKELKLPRDHVEELLLNDALVPWYGVLKGTLSNKYHRIEYLRFDPHENELIIQTASDSFAFYGRQNG